LSAANAQRKFGFERCSTDYRRLLDDETIDAVLVATRHALHAELVCQALAAGKAVLVEKPMAVDSAQLEQIQAAVAEIGNDRLMVGYNRRFAPILVGLKASWGGRSGPLQIRYDVNAGRLAADSWYGQPGEGSRLVGEGCHFVDLIRRSRRRLRRQRRRRSRRRRDHPAVPRRVCGHDLVLDSR
jgi:predicted dehydrogenase